MVRCALWAASLCGAWLLFSPSNAQAAEGSPVAPIARLVGSVTAPVAEVTKAVTPDEQATPDTKATPQRDLTLKAKSLSDKTSRDIKTQVSPVLSSTVDGLGSTASGAVRKTVAAVEETTAVVPVVQEPTKLIGAAVVEVTESLPLVGSAPVVRVPVVDPPVTSGSGADGASPVGAGTADPTDSTAPRAEVPDPTADAGASRSPVTPSEDVSDATRHDPGSPSSASRGALPIVSATGLELLSASAGPAGAAPAPHVGAADRGSGGDSPAPASPAGPPAPPPPTSGAAPSGSHAGELPADLPGGVARHTYGVNNFVAENRRLPASPAADPGSRPD